MPEVFGNLNEDATYTDFDYDAIDGPSRPVHVNPGLEAVSNWCSYVASDFRIEKMSEKAFVYASFLGLPMKDSLFQGDAASSLDTAQKLNQLGLCTEQAQQIFLPIMSWMTLGANHQAIGPRESTHFQAIGHRNLVFVYCIERGFLPFNTIEDLGIWAGVTKPRVQHLINEFYQALGIRHVTNKTKADSKAAKHVDLRIERARKLLFEKLQKHGSK